jgi:hypothetical protein
LCEEIKSCKWLVWHGKSPKAVARLKHICNAFEMVAGEPFFTLWLNLGRLIGYLESNDRYLVNYSRRHFKWLPISSSIAESAVNEVVSWRMAKKRQMRWSDERRKPTGASAGSRHQRGPVSEGICHTAATAKADSQTKQRRLLRTQGRLAHTLVRSPSRYWMQSNVRYPAVNPGCWNAALCAFPSKAKSA